MRWIMIARNTALIFTLSAGPALAGPAEDALIAADKAFSAMSAAKGAPTAFLAYIADDVRLFGSSGDPLIGKAKVQAFYASPSYLATNPLAANFTWEPAEAFASPDGKVGWTNGHWTYISPPDVKGARATSTGHYLTVWRKDPAGWKVVADMGTDDPPAKASGR